MNSARTLQPHVHRSVWDKLGIATSVACLIHCLAVPLLLPLLPMLALMKHTQVHGLLLVPIVALSGLGLLPGYIRHRAHRVLVFAGVGITLCSVAVVAEAWFDIHWLDAPLTVMGGVLLISAHVANLRRIRQARCGEACAA